VAKKRLERDEEDLVRLYLNDIGQYPLLTKNDEVRLAQQIEGGNAARGELEKGTGLSASSGGSRRASPGISQRRQFGEGVRGLEPKNIRPDPPSVDGLFNRVLVREGHHGEERTSTCLSSRDTCLSSRDRAAAAVTTRAALGVA